jgi:hypothetical protein
VRADHDRNIGDILSAFSLSRGVLKQSRQLFRQNALEIGVIGQRI